VTSQRRGKGAAEAPGGAHQTALRLGALFRYMFAFDRGAQLRAMEESGLTLTQCKALFVLAGPPERGACPGKDLAEQVGLSMATISRAVDGLVDASYATRVEDPEDRRVRRIAITEAGERAVGQIVSARLEGLREFAEGLSATERRKLDGALEVLLRRPELAAIYEDVKELGDR
jgi:DNA-binding MarR family transcriptional regulator